MHGAPYPVLANLAVPGVWPCFVVAAPFVAFALLRWINRRIDSALEHLYPHWKWQKDLGWFDLRTQRRVDSVWRWIGYLIYAFLAAALYGIVWAAPVFQHIDSWSEPDVLAELSFKLAVLLSCLAVWLLYLGLELLPRLRREHEAEELEKFRAEMAEREAGRDEQPDSRTASCLEKPHTALSSRPVRGIRRN